LESKLDTKGLGKLDHASDLQFMYRITWQSVALRAAGAGAMIQQMSTAV